MKIGKACKYDIIIQSTDNGGFYVKIGCGRFSFSDYRDLCDCLKQYLSGPEAWNARYMALIARMNTEPIPSPEPPNVEATRSCVDYGYGLSYQAGSVETHSGESTRQC